MKYLLFVSLIFQLLLSCNSNGDEAKQEAVQQGQDTAVNTRIAEEGTPVRESTLSYRCEFLFPSGLLNELKPKNLKIAYSVQTDSVCDMSYTDNHTGASLWVNLERNADTEQVKRLVKAFSYMPGLIGPIDAGDGGYVVRTTEKKNDIITAMFSVGSWKGTLESKIKTGTDTAGGILFSDDTLAELAVTWASQLKDLQQ